LNTYPFAFPVTSITGVTTTTPTNVGDLYGALSSIYCLSRGGVRMKFLDSPAFLADGVTPAPVPTGPFVSYNLSLATANAGLASANFATIAATGAGGQITYKFRTSAPQVFHQQVQNLHCEVQVPQYHRYHSRVNSEHMINGTFTYGINGQRSLATPQIIQHVYGGGGLGNTATSTLCRLGADDVNFGIFISIPPMDPSIGIGSE